MSFMDEEDIIKDINEDDIKTILEEIFPETPEDRWREFLK